MTDNEIIKALRCCASSPSCDACKGCPFDEAEICSQDSTAVARYALDIIERKQAEIKQYKRDQEKLIAERDEILASKQPQVIKINQVDISEDVRRLIKSGRVFLMPNVEPQIEVIPNVETIINDFKTALLKKIFPYDAADKKQYSINAYAVERAIIEVAEELNGGKRCSQ